MQHGLRASDANAPGPAPTIAISESTPLVMGATQSQSPRSAKSRVLLGLAAGVCGAVAVASSTPVNTSGPVQTLRDDRAISSSEAAARRELCDLYCDGPLLDAVQRSALFNDSKHFVDMPIKPNHSVKQVLWEFHQEIQPLVAAATASELQGAVVRDALRAFLAEHFDEPGSDIESTIPPDFALSPTPHRIATIEKPAYREWAIALHSLWKELGRSPRRDVLSSYLQPTPLPSLGDTSTSTLIVVPGGRFRESYYWDSYWIVAGLLVSGMHATARRVVQNLLEYVAEFGFVPNGGRIYYLTRSQPPLLSDMVRLVAAKQQPTSSSVSDNHWDLDYLRIAVPILAKEYEYWMETHQVVVPINGTAYQLNRYTTNATSPRPESYREDEHLAHATFPADPTRQATFYSDIIAAAESGWDFSSRWFTDHKILANIKTRDFVPVDLNVILHRVETNLAEFYQLLGQDEDSQRFINAAAARARAIDAVFWQEASHSWRDFDLQSQSHSPIVSASNYFPLWANAIIHNTDARIPSIIQSLQDSGLIQVAGIQTTTATSTGQQWDAPNAWPPLQDILIEGLLNVGTAESTALAKTLVRTWIDTSFQAWQQTGLMFEKYNATVVGGLGSGGEYAPQFGFGWTNGVVLKFLTEYQHFLN